MDGLFCGLSDHLHNGMGFRAERCEQASVDRAGVDHHDLATMFYRRSGGMPNHDRAVTAVVTLPERLTHIQIRLSLRVETGMGGYPSMAAVHAWECAESLQPFPRLGLSELVVGLNGQEISATCCWRCLEAIDQGLLVVATQPGGASTAHQIPNAMDAIRDVRTSVDHITAEHQMIGAGEHGQQTLQRIIATMNVANHPVVAAGGRHCDCFAPEKLTSRARLARDSDYVKAPLSRVMDPRSLSPARRVQLLVQALDGAKKTNEALARCTDGEEMLDVLLGASQKLGLGLTREQLRNTPPIRDWVWWKNKEALVTIGN